MSTTMDKLKKVDSLEQALTLLLPDDREFLPVPSLKEGEKIDAAVFGRDAHRRFQEIAAGNPTLAGEWKSKVVPAVSAFQQRRIVTEPNDIFYLKLGTLILQQLEASPSSGDFLGNVEPIPPGFSTAPTLGVVLMMFQADEEEGEMALNLGAGEHLDLSIFREGRDGKQKFETMLAKNGSLQKFWHEHVVTAARYFLDPKRDRNGNPEVLTADELRAVYGPNEEAKNNAAGNLKLGAAILKEVEADRRTWLNATALKLKSLKKVLGGEAENNLASIPALWFHLFAGQTTLRQTLGEPLYRYLLNGGFQRDDHVSYRELAELAEINGFEKGFFTRLFYGPSPEGKKTVREVLHQIQETTSYFEFEYARNESIWNVRFYVDMISPFIEIQLGREGFSPAILRAYAAGEGANPVSSLIVENPDKLFLPLLERIAFAVKQFLAADKKFEREKQIFERLVQI